MPEEKRNARLYQLMVESADDMAIISTDLQRNLTSWNIGAERILGYTEEEILGKSADIIFTDEQRARGDAEQEAEEAIAKGRAENERWHRRKDGSLFWGSGLMMALKGPSGEIEGLVKIFKDRSRLHEQEQNNRLLLDEMNHRVKNIISMVQALAHSLLRTTGSLSEFREAFSQRLQALSRAHDLLTVRDWQGASLPEVVSRTLEAYSATSERIEMEGPLVILRSHAAVALHLVFYELATNAAKYGALSTDEGRVTVRWRAGAEGRLTIEWIEEGGPPPRPNARRGFGSRLIEQSGVQLGGEIRVSIGPDGARCIVNVPLRDNTLAALAKLGAR